MSQRNTYKHTVYTNDVEMYEGLKAMYALIKAGKTLDVTLFSEVKVQQLKI